MTTPNLTGLADGLQRDVDSRRACRGPAQRAIGPNTVRGGRARVVGAARAV